MSEPFVDTDVIVRLLTGDDPKKQGEARGLFKAVEAGEMVLVAPTTVIFDVVYVLASPRLYHLPRAVIRDLLTPVLRPVGFKVDKKRELMEALDLYASSSLPFGDAMIVASMREADTSALYSYDREFDRVPGVERRQPGDL